MRNPERIYTVLSLLRMVWERYPDLRLGQLVIDVAGKDDPFQIEDDEWGERLEQIVGSGRFPGAVGA